MKFISTESGSLENWERNAVVCALCHFHFPFPGNRSQTNPAKLYVKHIDMLDDDTVATVYNLTAHYGPSTISYLHAWTVTTAIRARIDSCKRDIFHTGVGISYPGKPQ